MAQRKSSDVSLSLQEQHRLIMRFLEWLSEKHNTSIDREHASPPMSWSDVVVVDTFLGIDRAAGRRDGVEEDSDRPAWPAAGPGQRGEDSGAGTGDPAGARRADPRGFRPPGLADTDFDDDFGDDDFGDGDFGDGEP